MELTDAFNQISDVVIDAYFITDAEGRILDYNRAFFAFFSRSVARKLKTMTVSEAIPMERDVVTECMQTGRHVRLDEIPIRAKGAAEELRVILSAIPLKADDDTVKGSLVILRNVTDEAMIQVKYQEMLETEARDRERLVEQIKERTGSLVDANELLLDLQRELMEYKKGIRL